jgi:hypothetical protein
MSDRSCLGPSEADNASHITTIHKDHANCQGPGMCVSDDAQHAIIAARTGLAHSSSNLSSNSGTRGYVVLGVSVRHIFCVLEKSRK